MNIYQMYEERGLKNYKLRTPDDVEALHGTKILDMQGLTNLSEDDKQLVIKLFINYLNGCGCGNRQDVPVMVQKLNNTKFKIYFKDGMFVNKGKFSIAINNTCNISIQLPQGAEKCRIFFKDFQMWFILL